jgi:hypothetical protein
MAATFSRRKGRGPYRTRLTGQLAISSILLSSRFCWEIPDINRLRFQARLLVQALH